MPTRIMYMPQRPFSLIDAVNRMAIATGSYANAARAGGADRTIYTRAPIRLTDTTRENVQPTDVLFDPQGAAWQASNAGEWQEASGYAVELTRAGVRGRAPW